MINLTTFLQGLYKDLDPTSQPPHTYNEVWNAIRSKDGSIFNEKGMRKLNLKIDRILLGSCVLDEEIILFYTSLLNEHEIGILDKNGNYQMITDHPALGFSPSKQIKAVARKDYRKHRLVYFCDDQSMRCVDLDAIPSHHLFDSYTKLYLSYQSPQINYTGIGEGLLTTGTYQFALRLLTKGLDATPVSLITNPISIVNESRIGGRDNYDGANIGVAGGKSIKLALSNLDLSYTYAEVLVITYEGLANTMKISTCGRIPIKSDTASFTYYSPSQNKLDVTLEELLRVIDVYEGAKCVEVKDNTLIWSNLWKKKPIVNYQEIVNAFIIKYHIEEVALDYNINIKSFREEGDGKGIDKGESTQSFNDYKDELVAADKRSYMRGEVYSFTATPVFTNGTKGDAYHIPATGEELANISTKLLGKYTSSIDYPTDMGYPEGKITHHRMPSLSQEPHYREASGTIYIRLLGIALEGITLPEGITGWIIGRQLRTEDNKSILAQGIAQPFVNNNSVNEKRGYFLTPHTGKFPYTNGNVYFDGNSQGNIDLLPEYTLAAFYSPEATILGRDLSRARTIESVLSLKGTTHSVTDTRAGRRYEKEYHSFLDYDKVGSETTGTKVDIKESRWLEESKGEIDEITSITFDSKKIFTLETNGMQLLSLTESLPMEAGEEMHYDDVEFTDVIRLRKDGVMTELVAAGYKGDTQRFLYNLTVNNDSQYGYLHEGEFFPIGYLSGDGVLFGGDTFIGKYYVMSTMREMGITGMPEEKWLGMRFRTGNYIILESTVNLNYRHYSEESVPYYPKYKKLYTADGDGLFQILPSLGHANGYNKQYSFENNIGVMFTKSVDVEEIEDFSNRSIYSNVLVEGATGDAWRVYLPNNYYDEDKSKGEIWNTFVWNGSFYHHCTGSLYRCFVNEQRALITDSSEVYVGNGGLFAQRSIQVFPVKGGYAGTSSQWAGCTTPFGYFFIDNMQGKVFMLGESLEEISDKGLFDFFRDNITMDEDNPSQGVGFISVYDYAYKRWILSRHAMGVLKAQYRPFFKGVYEETNEFLDTLVPGESIVFKDNKYQLYIGRLL